MQIASYPSEQTRFLAWATVGILSLSGGCGETAPTVTGATDPVGLGAGDPGAGAAQPGVGSGGASQGAGTGGELTARGAGAGGAVAGVGGAQSAAAQAAGGTLVAGTGGVASIGTGGIPQPVGPLGSVCSNLPSYDNNGSATWYQFAQGSTEVNCSFPILSTAALGAAGDRVGGISTGNGEYFVALNTTDYESAAMCGACIEVTRGNGNSVVATVVDHCPSATNPNCTAGHVDLSRAAFSQLADPGSETGFLGTGNGGHVDTISWHFVECPVGASDITVRLKEPDNQYWNEILIQNTRYPVSRVESLVNGSWVQAQRQSYNYFTPPGGDLGVSPYQVRVADVNGSAVELSVGLASGDIPTGQQFPPCQ